MPNFRLVGDLVLLQMGVRGVCICFSQHGLVRGWMIAGKDYLGCGIQGWQVKTSQTFLPPKEGKKGKKGEKHRFSPFLGEKGGKTYSIFLVNLL